MNILLIEDDAGLVELISTNLEESGFSVLCATSGAEALALLEKQTPNLMLLDYSLPDINGKELIETLNKQQMTLPPFIITTGQGDERIAVDMMKLGAMDYIVKDIFFLEKLPNVITRVIKEIESDGKLKQAEFALRKSEESIKELILQTSSKTGQAFFNSTTKTLGNILNADYTFIGKYIDGTKSVETISLNNKGNIIENFAYKLKDTPCDNVINQDLCSHKSDVANKFPDDILLTDMGIEGYIGVPLYDSNKKPQGILVALYENEIEDLQSKENLMQFFASRTETELERHEIETSLKASEERFRNAITYAPFPIMIHSEGKVLQLSKQWTKQTGYTIDDIPTIKKWTLKAYGPDAVPSSEFIENLYKIDKTQYDGEWEVKNKDGSYRLWDFSSSPIGKLPNGKKMVISMASDITERKHAEETLKIERDKFNFILSELPIGVSVADADHKFIYINPISAKIDRYPKESQDILGKNVLSVHSKDIRLGVEQLLKDFESGVSSSFRREAKRGKRIVDVSYHALRDSQKKYLGLVRLVSDITESKHAETALRDSKERFELAMAASKDGLFDWNLVSNEIYYSPGWKSILGYEDEELPNDFTIWEKLTEPEDVKRSWEMQQELINKQRDRFELEFKMKHKEGHWVDILSRAEAVFDDSSKAIRVVGTHVDISERKREEKILAVELKLFEYATNHSEEELLQKFLDEAEKLTDSKIGFFHYIEDDQESISLQAWSSNTLNNMCEGSGEATRHYPISKAGVWIDCIKERKPVIHNDYSGLKHKKGLPEGHAPIIRELVVPVIRGNQIKAVLGVGNKESDYKENDVKSIQRLADAAWETVVRKQAEEKIRAAEETAKINEKYYKNIINNMGDPVFVKDQQSKFLLVNDAFCKIVDLSMDKIIGRTLAEDFPPDEMEHFLKKDKQVLLDGQDDIAEELLTVRGGKTRTISTRKTRFIDNNGKRFLVGVIRDLTESKQAEEKIHAAEEKYRIMIETSNDLIWMLDQKGHFTFVNTHAEKATGYLKKDIIGNSFIPLVLEDELPFLNDVFTKTMSGESISYEMSLKTVYGNTLTLAVNTAPLSADGKVYSALSFARDITLRKEAERLLKESEKRFKALHNASFGGITIHDMGIIKDCNQGLSDITGYTIDELIGMDGLLCIAEDSRKVVRQNILASYEKAYEVVGLRKNGDKFPLRLEGKMIPYEGKTMRVVEFRDISEQKKAEDDIRRLSTAVKQSPSIIVITDPDGKLEYINPKFTELTGYASSEAIGQESNILKSGKQDPSFYKEMWATVESGKVWRGQFHNKKKNGELFWEAASISAILNESGEVINFIKIGEDITQQKNAETELKSALAKAMESDRLKSAFLSNMSHEIRTPMNGILGFINLLNEPDLSKDEIDQYTNVINRGGERLLNTINDIIDISRIEAGEMVISKTETSINNIMDELYAFYSSQAKQKGLSLLLESHHSNEQITVITDSHKLHGVLTNLIKNAIKFTKKGHIAFGYLIKKKSIDFFVKDTGIGIPKSRIQAIFNRFEQADIEDAMAFEGSGLGLAISKAYIDMLGGEIFVESNEGQGSKFIFTIPYVKQETQETEPILKETNNNHAKTEKMNLLIVEDEKISSDLLETILAGMFNKITTVQTGIEAIEICKNTPEIDLVLMDIKLPEMNGYTATQEIRKFNKDLVIIAQTAYALAGDKEKAIEAGCNDYISKPINKKLLLEMIKKHMSK